jgi:hypothetical protein
LSVLTYRLAWTSSIERPCRASGSFWSSFTSERKQIGVQWLLRDPFKEITRGHIICAAAQHCIANITDALGIERRCMRGRCYVATDSRILHDPHIRWIMIWFSPNHIQYISTAPQRMIVSHQTIRANNIWMSTTDLWRMFVYSYADVLEAESK